MKLDKDLVRQILLAIEADNNDPRLWTEIAIPDQSSEVVSYHVLLLAEAGFLEATNTGSMSRFEWKPSRLTYQGHEFLDTIRDDAVWRKTKAVAAKVGGASVSLIWEIAKAELKIRLGLP